MQPVALWRHMSTTTESLPKAGDKIWNTGHEFIVTEPMLTPIPESYRSAFSHQFTYKGVCTDHECNDSIRNTGYNGGCYGWGVNI